MPLGKSNPIHRIRRNRDRTGKNGNTTRPLTRLRLPNKPVRTLIKKKVVNPLIEKAINAGVNWLDDWGADTLDDVIRSGVRRLKTFVQSSDNKIDDNILSKLPEKIQRVAVILNEEVNPQ